MDRKRLKREADDLWSRAVKARDGHICQKCGKAGTNAHHIFSRSILHLRHDLENGLCLCPGCHTLGRESAHKGPEAFRDWLISKKGKAWFDALKQRAAIVQKPDYQMRIMELKACSADIEKVMRIGLVEGTPESQMAYARAK